MKVFRCGVFAVLSAALFVPADYGATFGTNVPVKGEISDLAWDQGRKLVYGANFSAKRIEVLNTATKTLQSPKLVPKPPSAVSLGPDGRFLVVGEYETAPVSGQQDGALTIFDLNANTSRTIALPDPVLSVAF